MAAEGEEKILKAIPKARLCTRHMYGIYAEIRGFRGRGRGCEEGLIARGVVEGRFFDRMVPYGGAVFVIGRVAKTMEGVMGR